MYLSNLLIDVGVNPDRPRPGRTWLRNIYRVHQRLCMAFPSVQKRRDDEDFLTPFRPDDFGAGQVRVPRDHDAGILFRVDPLPGGRAAILVQSATKPDWDYAFHNASHFLAGPPQVKIFAPELAQGQSCRFRLVANPTRRLSKRSTHKNGDPVSEGWVGKRVPVPPDRCVDWLARRGESQGFRIESDSTALQIGYVYANKGVNGSPVRYFAARFDGRLTVTDPALFLQALASGIGSAKAFGFGLLSVAPL